jgi:hypothetical protein
VTLISIFVPGDKVQVTGTTVGEHFALHSSIAVNATGEFSLEVGSWDLHHIPSGRCMLTLWQSDPLEYPGEPRMLNQLKVEAFVKWLEGRIDCSVANPDFSTLSEADQRIFQVFRNDPNYVIIPDQPANSVT